MKIYRHYRPRTVVFPLVVFGILGLFGIVGLMLSLAAGWAAGPPPFFFLMMVAIAAINGWLMAGFAIEVRLEDDGFVEFIGPLRRVRLAALDITSIAPSQMSQLPVYV